MKKIFGAAWVLGAVLGTTTPAFSAPPAPSAAAEAARARKLEIEKKRAARDAYLKQLDAALTAEVRDEKWAAEQERTLRKGYAAFKAPNGAKSAAKIASIDCRKSRCKVEIAADKDPRQLVAQQQAINDWISSSQACGYTLAMPVPGADGGTPIRIYLECAP